MKSQRQPPAPAREGAINRIGELEFCFGVSEASQQLGAPEKLLMAVRAELLEIIDSTLADAARDRSDLQLEKLDIDLGAFPDPPDWQHVRTTLRERLLAELMPYLYPASVTPVASANTQRIPTRQTAANLPGASSEGMNADVTPTSPGLTGSVARASNSEPPLSDAASPLFRSTRQTPHGRAVGKSDAPGRVGQDASPATPEPRIFRFAPARTASPDKPGTEDRDVPLVRTIAEALHDMAGDRSDISRREHLLAELRWRRQNAPQRLHAELATLSAPELLQLAGVLELDGNFEHEGSDGVETSLTRDKPVRKSRLIDRIEHALGSKDASPVAQMATTELTAALRGLFPDAKISPPDPQRLSALAESALQVAADATTPVPNGSAASDPKEGSTRPDLTRMSIAELRVQIDGYLPETATELSASIDQLSETSADHIEALRVVAQALLDGKPIDLEHARRAIRDDAHGDGWATSAIMNLLCALNVPEAEITAFIQARRGSEFHGGGTDGAGMQSEGLSSLTPQPPRSGSLKPAASPSGRNPALSESARYELRKQNDTSPRGHRDIRLASPDRISTESPAPLSAPPRESASGADAETGDGRPGTPEPPQGAHPEPKADRVGTPRLPSLQEHDHDHEPPLRQSQTGSYKDKPKALTDTSVDPAPTPDSHTARTSPAKSRKGGTSGTSRTSTTRTDTVAPVRPGTPKESLADTRADENSSPERKRQADDDAGAVDRNPVNTLGTPPQSESSRRDVGKLRRVADQDTLSDASTPAPAPNDDTEITASGGSETTEAPTTGKGAAAFGTPGTIEGPLADSGSDETSAPDHNRRADDDAGAGEDASTKAHNVPTRTENPRRDAGKPRGGMDQDSLSDTSPPARGLNDNTGASPAEGSETTQALTTRKDIATSGKPGIIENSRADTGPDETSAPDRKLQTDDGARAGERASTNTQGVSNISTPVSEPISDPYPPDTASHQDTPKPAQPSSNTDPEDHVEEPLATPFDIRDTQMSERRLGDLLDAAATPDAPRLRDMFELIWRALPQDTDAYGQDRIRYWQTALVAVLSTTRGHSATERATDAFLTMAEPDDASRHNLLRVLLARLGYGQPGSDPILRRQTCTVLENLLAGDTAPPAASANTDPDASFIPTAHAGLVIFHPYLPMLFDRMALLTPQKHIRPEQLPRAAAALAALADATPAPSVLDPLERLLLAMPDGAELVPHALPDSDLSLIDSLLRSVLAQWPRLGQTSPASLCETFIRRTGIIQTEGETPRLLVDEGPFDMLLDGLPWALSPVALPWMTLPLTVIWRQGDD